MDKTNYTEVMQLAKNIMLENRKMVEQTEELLQNLKTLQGTFLDDGIDEVNEMANSIAGKLKNSQEAFMTTANELVVYARLLAAGKGKTV
jgi:ABC-type transporter Mla subunit MlaD